MTDVEKKLLWEQYFKTKSSQIREKLIIEYAPLVKLVAGRMHMYLGFNVEYDDLVGYGIFGLIDAIDKFDLMKDAKFETYASLRIRGAILDQIRKMDWIPRTIRQRQRKIDAAISEIGVLKGHEATDAEISEKLGISEKEYSNWQDQMKVSALISLNDFIERGADVVEDVNNHHMGYLTPERAADKAAAKQAIQEALEVLNEKEKKIILLYYYNELTSKEIGRILDVSESRVSQIHTQALAKMRKVLGDFSDVINI